MDNDTELELNKTKDKRQKTMEIDIKILRYQDIKTRDDKLRMKNELKI
jgi:hypothetical protein